MNSITNNPVIKFQLRISKQVIKLCAHHSNKRFRAGTIKGTGSAADFIKEAVYEKMVRKEVPVNYLKSIFKMS